MELLWIPVTGRHRHKITVVGIPVALLPLAVYAKIKISSVCVALKKTAVGIALTLLALAVCARIAISPVCVALTKARYTGLYAMAC